ncbi:MAG: DUF1080 domain-containing protein [Sedimentisphaerales bacterium]|nr:DUF1080 domain-containing protein [Sedimentisphaerales bacterium]
MKSRTMLYIATGLAGGALLGVTFCCFAQKRASEWKAHDRQRTPPETITPGETCRDAPSDAEVLFDGTDLSRWQQSNGQSARWKVEKGYMEVVKSSGSIYTRKPYGDCQLHLEWAAPDPAVGRDQDRGNSGIKFMGLYEVQVLDSYRADTYADGQAAAIYGQYPPLVNACKPPGAWQTYDIVFRRPVFDAAGKLARPAYLTVFHNGVLVQDHEEVLGNTSGSARGYQRHSDELPIMLQDHSHPVRYRNIWVRRLGEPRLP